MYWNLLMACATLGCACIPVLAATESLPDVEVARAADLDAKTWSVATEIEGKSFRSIKAGQRGLIPLKVWWGEGIRPAESSNALVRITFRDTAAEPVVVEAFAALPAYYELHRIGGTGDGAWKTALVPLPWDLVARHPGTDLTEIALQAPAGVDLPVSRIQLVAGDPVTDEARWAAETRAWVERVQSAKRKQAAPRKADGTAVIPATLKDAAVVPFTRGYLRMLYPDSTPQVGETGLPLKFVLAQNEIEPAQFGVYAPYAALKNVRVSLAPENFVDAGGTKLDARVDLFAAEYAVAGDQKLFPQRLWPVYPVDILAGGTHGFWLTIETTGKTKAGTYRGALCIEADGQKPTGLPVEIQVQPIRLIEMDDAGLHYGACVTGLIPAHEVRLMRQHNHNSINLWYASFAPKIIKRSATEFDLDFTIADEWMKHAKAAGVRNFVYFLGGDPYGAPDTFNLQRELYRQVFFDGADQTAGRKEFIQKVTASPDKMLPELRALYVQWVKKFMAHAKEAGWPEPLITPFDEPAKWVQDKNAAEIYFYQTKQGQDRIVKVLERDRKKFETELQENGLTVAQIEHWGRGGAGAWIKPQFKQACAAIHEAWPATRIYASIHHADSGLPFLEDVDVFCTNAIHEDSRLGDKVRAAGPSKAFWQYSGGGDRSEPSQGRYDFGFFFGSYNSRGSLCWAYNWGRRFDTSVGENWLYAWTTPYGVVRAPYWEGVREAWDDRRYIETLRAEARKAGKEAEAEALLTEIFKTAVSQRASGGRDTVNDFWARTKDPDALDAMRGKIAAKILELRSSVP
jgi:hypothetical protein